MWDYQPIVDGTMPRHVFLVCLSKEAKHERGKQAEMKCSLVISASVSIFSFLPLVLTLFFIDQDYKLNNQSLPNLFWSQCFITATAK